MTTQHNTSGLAIVTDDHKGLAVVTTQRFRGGATVVGGTITAIAPRRTTHSFQTGWDTHVELAAPACFVNHSCEPNLGIRDNAHGGFDFLALHDIAPGKELTWDYETSESTSIAVPDCLCGATTCRGEIHGYDVRRRIDPSWKPSYIANYLREKLHVHATVTSPRSPSNSAATGAVSGLCHAAADRQ